MQYLCRAWARRGIVDCVHGPKFSVIENKQTWGHEHHLLHPSYRSWNSNTLATCWEEPTHWKRPWFWERWRAGGEGDDRGWDGWMASPTRWTWVWASSGRWWRTGRPGVLRSMGLQRVRHDWATNTFKYFWFLPELVPSAVWSCTCSQEVNSVPAHPPWVWAELVTRFGKLTTVEASVMVPSPGHRGPGVFPLVLSSVPCSVDETKPREPSGTCDVECFF